MSGAPTTMADDMYDADLQVEGIWHLPAAVATERFSDGFSDLLESWGARVCELLGLDYDEITAEIEDCPAAGPEIWQETLNRATGVVWLVDVSVPTYRPTGTPGVASVHSGWRKLGLFGASKFEDAIASALVWAEESRLADLAVDQ